MLGFGFKGFVFSDSGPLVVVSGLRWLTLLLISLWSCFKANTTQKEFLAGIVCRFRFFQNYRNLTLSCPSQQAFPNGGRKHRFGELPYTRIQVFENPDVACR